LDPTSGHEQQGTRPVLVISPSAFKRLTKTPVVLPITRGGSFARTAGFSVSLILKLSRCRVPDDYVDFFEKMGLLCVPLLEGLERRLVVQDFLRDVVIIQVKETFKGCLQGCGH